MTIEEANTEKNVENKEVIHQRIKNELEELGLSECPEEIIERFVLIEQYSVFNQDARMIREAFGNVIDYISSGNGNNKPSEDQRRDGELAAYLHDIGKTSSKEERACQIATIKLFSVENIKNGDQTVLEVIENYLSDEKEWMLLALSNAGVSGEMTMREFWDKHAFWTKEILEKYPGIISERVKLISASHHIDHDINPCGVEEDMIPEESRIIGSLEKYIDLLEERVLIALDKYQAAMFRPKEKPTHEVVMNYMRSSLKKYQTDSVMKSIIDAIDKLGSEGMLFPKTASMKLSERV
jgi:hypothetical protein